MMMRILRFNFSSSLLFTLFLALPLCEPGTTWPETSIGEANFFKFDASSCQSSERVMNLFLICVEGKRTSAVVLAPDGAVG